MFGNECCAEDEIDETKITQKYLINLKKVYNKNVKKSKDSFFNAVLWGAYFKIKTQQNFNSFNDEELKNVLGVDFVNKFMEIKDDIVLDISLDTFQCKMHLVNDILYEKICFYVCVRKKNV